jgi:hypothetical protein
MSPAASPAFGEALVKLAGTRCVETSHRLQLTLTLPLASASQTVERLLRPVRASEDDTLVELMDLTSDENIYNM